MAVRAAQARGLKGRRNLVYDVVHQGSLAVKAAQAGRSTLLRGVGVASSRIGGGTSGGSSPVQTVFSSSNQFLLREQSPLVQNSSTFATFGVGE